MKHVQENKIIGEGISMLKKFVVLPTLALTFAVGTTACKEKDIAVVGGAIAIVAGAVAIGAVLDSNDHAHRPQCRGGYVEQCRSTYDWIDWWSPRSQTHCFALNGPNQRWANSCAQSAVNAP
jgi:hypothetical protein